MARRPGRSTAWTPWTLAGAVGIAAVGAVALHLMGRRLWCACGSAAPWSWDVWSPHNSQHLVDPYTFTHVLHGVVVYALLRLAVGARWAPARVLAAVTIEVAWEIVENTTAVIQAYRESTIALHYDGDSIANSLADVAAFAAGYIAASRLPAWICALGFLAVEVVLLLAIRDGLLLNVLMLLYPVPALKAWQMGGG